jgi:NADH:ubiquinone oxidoreductase subunit E
MQQPANGIDRTGALAMHPTTLVYSPPDTKITDLIDELGGRRAHVIEVLQNLHAEYGQLTPVLITEVARQLHLPVSRVHGIATFYSMLATPALPEKTIRICDGPCCMMRGAAELLSRIQAQVDGSWTITRTS